MYQNNIYIDNYEELSAITLPNGDKADWACSSTSSTNATG